MPFLRRQRHVGHAAVPGGIVGNDRLQAGELHQLAAGILSQPMRAAAERVEANAFQEIDRRRHGQIGRVVARAGPDELVGPAFDPHRRNAAPAQDGRPDEGLVLRRDVQEARAKRPAQPFVAARGVEIAAQRVDRDGHLGQGVRPVDGDGDPAAAGLRRRSAAPAE